MTDFQTELEELRAEVRKARQEAELGVIVEGKDVGVTGNVTKDIGKPGGWAVAAEGSWMQKTGAKIAALLTWKGK